MCGCCGVISNAVYCETRGFRQFARTVNADAPSLTVLVFPGVSNRTAHLTSPCDTYIVIRRKHVQPMKQNNVVCGVFVVGLDEIRDNMEEPKRIDVFIFALVLVLI
jgi:hypothetical protein